MTLHDLLLEYLSAYNQHDVNKIVSFLHPDCRITFNGQLVVQGAEAIRCLYEDDFLKPQASATLAEFKETTNDPDRIQALLKMKDGRLIDVTYVFETKENDDKKLMIEHIIHSVTTSTNTP